MSLNMVSWDVPLDAGFLCSQAAMTWEMTEGTLYDDDGNPILGLLQHAMDITMRNSFIVS
jgi:hypothetical protein